MRWITLALGALVFSVTTQAQTANNPAHKVQMRRFFNESRETAATAAKTTGLEPRLRAISVTSNSQVMDSNYYGYSGIRHSGFDFDNMYYNDYLNMAQVKHDTQRVYKWNGSSLAPLRVYYSQYNGNNYMRNQYQNNFFGSVQMQFSNDSFFYNNNSILTKHVHYTYNNITGIYDTTSQTLYAYAAGKLVQEVNYVYNGNNTWVIVDRTDYNYDVNNKISVATYLDYNGTTWDSTYRFKADYYGSGMIKTLLTQNYMSGWVNEYKDSFGYGAVNYHTYFLEQEWTGAQWRNSYLETKHVNVDMLPDTVAYSEWNNTTLNWASKGKSAWLYDTFDVPTFSYELDSAGALTATSKYYYSLYNAPNNSVSSVTRNDLFNLYPNPVADMLNIRFAQNTNEVAYTIINTTGQVLRRGALNGNNSIPTGALQPGMYRLIIHDKERNEYGQQAFIKQ